MTAPAATPEQIAVAAFLKRHEKWLRHAKREHFLPFIQWYWRDARIGVVRENGRVRAVALVRAVDEVAQANEPYFHAEKGRIVWIDHIASCHPLGVPILMRQAMQRFGPREAFAGHVFNRDGELRMLPWQVVERMTKQNDHGLTEHPRAACCA